MAKEVQASLKFYTFKRFLQSIPLIFGVIIVNFILLHAAPGGPILILAGEAGADPQFLEMLRKSLGLDKPLYEQLLIYIWNALQGDLGLSFYYRQPVTLIIWQRLPATLLLMATQYVAGAMLGIVLGVIAATKAHSIKDNAISVSSLVWYALPVFWSAQLLLLTLSLQLGLFPTHGMTSAREEFTGIPYIIDVLHHLALPALSLSLFHLAIITRLTRASMLEVLRQDFIMTARAKGLEERIVIYKHALRNALLPVATVLGVSFGLLLTGAVLTETVFAWPGMGRLMFESISRRDYPVLMGTFVFASFMIIIANFITDILYSVLDPRIRYR